MKIKPYTSIHKHLHRNVIILMMLVFGCNTGPELWETDTKELVISQFIESNPDFSEFNELIKTTSLNTLLSVRGPYTLFLPPNNQMLEYYKFKGVKSFRDFTPDFQKKLVLNHIIGARIETDDIGLGAISELNAIGDFIVTEFDGSDIVLNKNSKITKRNINTSNGFIHIINKVLDPVTKSVYEVLEDNPSYSIFTEGLKKTNLKDTLQIIDFMFGQKPARNRFTILAIADSTFNRFGIFTVNDLINKFTNAPDSLIYQNNGFYRYMEYHCLAETYFLSDFETKLYPILSFDNNIFITIAEDYKINLMPDKSYTHIVTELSNLPCKNGTIHTISDLLPVVEPKPSVVTWETTDHFDLRQGDYYRKYYMRWFDGQNTFANIKWEGDYLLYYYKPGTSGWNLNADCLSMSGWWWVEVKTPKIMKGKYKVTGNIWNGGDKSNYEVKVDGVSTVMVMNTQSPNTTSWGEFEWTKTEAHKIRIIAKTPGLLFWDTVIFTPIN